MTNPEVDDYIGRSKKWPEEMAGLRSVLLGAGLDESIKWRSPCFSHKGKNVVIFQEFNDKLSLMFFKGALLSDPAGVLVEQGPNSRSAKRMEFTSVDQVDQLSEVVTEYVREAIDVAESGMEVDPPQDVSLVDELQERLDADPDLKAAFQALTPGRQREYNLYVSGAKQSKTRSSRVEKYASKIREGKGLRDR